MSCGCAHLEPPDLLEEYREAYLGFSADGGVNVLVVATLKVRCVDCGEVRLETESFPCAFPPVTWQTIYQLTVAKVKQLWRRR